LLALRWRAGGGGRLLHCRAVLGERHARWDAESG
jgi:hypothetical protein